MAGGENRMTGKQEEVVTKEMTARHMGSGSLDVFATPALVALMEKAACNALSGLLEEGVTTVGTRMEVSHESATPVGMRVWAEAKLVSQEGKAYEFEITAYDECGLIGKAFHQRVSVKAARFQEKTNSKRG
jgi:predicted thioesterase